MVVAQVIATVSSLNVQYVVLFVIVILLTIIWVRGRGPPNLPPGPLAWPVVGNALALRKGPVHHVLADWAKQYGSIMRIRLPRLAIVLNDIDAAKEALVRQAGCFSDRNGASGTPVQGSISMANGDVRKERRRFWLTALRNIGMGKKSVEHNINEEALHLIESFGDGEKSFVSEHNIHNAVSNIICTISFGERFEYSDPKFAHLIHCIRKTFYATTLDSTIFSLPWFMSLFRRKPADNTPEWIWKVMTFIKDVVKEHEESFDPNNIRGIIDMCLVEIERQEKSGKVVDEDSALCRTTIWRAIFELFLAGTDSTSNTIMWMLQFMIVHQDVQEMVQKEIDDVVGCDRQPTREDRNNMPYTNAVLMEVLRIRPVAPYGAPHETRHEEKLLGYTIPANTNDEIALLNVRMTRIARDNPHVRFNHDMMYAENGIMGGILSFIAIVSLIVVICNIWAIQRDLKSWKDPEKFDPTRFMSKDGNTVENHEASIPFSLGRRVCLGESLAKMEVFLFCVNLLQRFTFSLPVDKPPPSLDGVLGITLMPNPCEIVAKKR